MILINFEFAGGGQFWQKGYFKPCPNCNKKGLYKPRSLITKTTIYNYGKKCKYCGYGEGKDYEVTK